MTAKRALTLVFGLILASFIAKTLIFYLNPSFRLHGVGYAYDYTKINYLQFFILALLPGIVALFLYRTDFKILNKFYDRAAEAIKKMFLAGIENKEAVLLFAIAVFWVFNLMEYAFFSNLVESKKFDHAPFDTYHEGEKIGFLPTFLNNDEALKEMLIEHGYILEVLTPYLAYLIAPENHAVMGFRLMFTLQTLLSWLGAIWVIWEIVLFTAEKEPKFILNIKFALLSLIFAAGNDSFLTLDYQHGIFFFQLGLVFHYLRKLTYEDIAPKFILILSFIIGLAIPLGLLYSTKYGLVFCVVFVLFLFLLFFHKHYTLFLLGSSVGAVISGTVACLMLGWGQVLELGKMFLYWIEFFPPRFSEPFISDQNEHYLWVPQVVIGILIICGIHLIISFKQSKTIQSFFRENTHIIVLLFLSILVLKVGLDCSDKRHFRAMSPPSLLLLFTLATRWLDKLEEFRLYIVHSYTTYKTTWILILVFLLFVNMNPKKAFQHVKPYWKKIATTDDGLLAVMGFSYLQAVEEIRPEVKDMECFYTLTSEGVWYYHLNKPSCSRHHILLWAVPLEAGHEIIDDLRSKKPEVILYSNLRATWSFVTSHLQPEVYQFVHQNYRPYKLVGNHWFWKRSSRGMEGAKNIELDISSTTTTYKYDKSEGFITLAGALELRNFYNIEAIYMTSADQETPLAVSWYVNQTHVKDGQLASDWSIKVPMINISPEIKNLQLWGYSSSNHERIKIGEMITLDHSKINTESNYQR